MNSLGLWMLLALGVLIVATGLPVWALLIGVASAFAVLGLGLGAFDAGILAALPGRIVGLLEHDLLQALPLYVFIGVLLQRLTVADALFASLARLLRPLGAGQPLAALGVGALIAPMNGSVASSSALLSRLVAPRLGSVEPGRATALISVAATIGVVVPPSLVLILLGDAMLRAHTEASNLPGFVLGSQRIINTQDVLHAALLPAACVLALWALVAWWQSRGSEPKVPEVQVPRSQHAIALIAGAVILGLLGGVFSGRLLAVEAAATGGVLLMAATLASRALSWPAWRAVLADTLALSGALFALLVGATTFSLVFRVFGTDRWLTELVLGSPLSPQATAALVLLGVALCAWVLDAFEMIFVIIPIIAPPLIARLGDAQQAAVLLLLVLQLSFLIPPMGYAVLMARARSGLPQVPMRRLLRALLPFVGVQLALVALVFAAPRLVHQLDAPLPAAGQAAPMSEQDIVRQMEEMASPPADGADDAGSKK
ncbi:TRAP transporter large permease subunit [Variovorax terrae]|uniref:TRAP transporter large permease subunit n=1 Tax=Variovorax terrae TaxID=2923278 RepID=A0A9X1VUY3_9BURK|nr:TRAP transporter large permease subunit [Variovorax terrae]MCJ0763425.1 TRAP transporter large permease subunit [Variovorax terrae]